MVRRLFRSRRPVTRTSRLVESQESVTNQTVPTNHEPGCQLVHIPTQKVVRDMVSQQVTLQEKIYIYLHDTYRYARRWYG